MIRLAIAEDHQSLIDGITLLLELESNISIVGTANNGEDLINIVKKQKPNVIITDIRMPKLDGINATKIIKKEFPETKVIAFTMYDQTDAIQQMIKAGASGYLLKNSSLKDVLDAINTVFNGNTYFDANLDTNALNISNASNNKSILTKRQIQILALIAKGKTSREIAEELFIGTHTVDTHRKNMVRILNLKGKGELLRYALEKKYKF